MEDKYTFKRDFYTDVVRSLQISRATFLLGPKRCGKTVCLMQIMDEFENAEYVDFKGITESEGMDVLSRIEESIEKDEDKIYLLDEITYAPNPELYVLRIAISIDKHDATNTRVVFSGSPSCALSRWGRIALKFLDVSAEFVKLDFLSYAEWLKYKNFIKTPSAENYEQFLHEFSEFHGITSMREYLQECLDVAVLANEKTRSVIYGNDCELLDVDILMEVCCTTLFALHNHMNEIPIGTSSTIMERNGLKDDISDSFISRYHSFKTRDLKTLEQAFLFLKNCGLIAVTAVISDLEKVILVSPEGKCYNGAARLIGLYLKEDLQ